MASRRSSRPCSELAMPLLSGWLFYTEQRRVARRVRNSPLRASQLEPAGLTFCRPSISVIFGTVFISLPGFAPRSFQRSGALSTLGARDAKLCDKREEIDPAHSAGGQFGYRCARPIRRFRGSHGCRHDPDRWRGIRKHTLAATLNAALFAFSFVNRSMLQR